MISNYDRQELVLAPASEACTRDPWHSFPNQKHAHTHTHKRVREATDIHGASTVCQTMCWVLGGEMIITENMVVVELTTDQTSNGL